jgi:hypothetical protein
MDLLEWLVEFNLNRQPAWVVMLESQFKTVSICHGRKKLEAPPVFDFRAPRSYCESAGGFLWSRICPVLNWRGGLILGSRYNLLLLVDRT